MRQSVGRKECSVAQCFHGIDRQCTESVPELDNNIAAQRQHKKCLATHRTIVTDTYMSCTVIAIQKSSRAGANCSCCLGS